MHAAAWSQLLPPAAVGRGFRVPAHRWIALGCLVSVTGDAVQFGLGARGINNHWVSYLSTPLMGAAFLWGLSWFQPGLVGRLALRLTVPALVVTWYALTLVVEDTATFSRFVYPLQALLLLAAALWTLLRLGLAPSQLPLPRTDWFWVVGGLALYATASALIHPLAAALLREREDLVVAAYQVRATSFLVSFLAIAWGMWCPRPVKPSGPSSSPAPSA
jgi:hypothetical protein